MNECVNLKIVYKMEEVLIIFLIFVISFIRVGKFIFFSVRNRNFKFVWFFWFLRRYILYVNILKMGCVFWSYLDGEGGLIENFWLKIVLIEIERRILIFKDFSGLFNLLLSNVYVVE